MEARLTRIGELIRRELSLLLRTQFQQEQIQTTIVDAEISPDLKHAKVFFSVINSEKNLRQVVLFFRKHKGRFRHHLAKTIRLKYFPDLHFIFDDSIERGTRIMQLCNEIEEKDSPITQ